MPSNIVLRNLSTPPVKASDPLISTAPGLRTGTRGNDPTEFTGWLFEDGFDAQPDWHSMLPANDTGAHPTGEPDRIQRAGTHTFLNNWYSCYQDSYYSEFKGNPGGYATISVLDADSGEARGGTGKCVRMARESYQPESGNPNFWASDSQLGKYFPEGKDQLYIEFWIRFGPEWTAAAPWASKLFRVHSWSGQGSEYQGFADSDYSEGQLGPIMLWDWNQTTGVRNGLAFRGGPHGQNYSMDASRMPGLPRALVGLGDLPLNWCDDTFGMAVGGGNPQVPDLVNGGYLADNPGQVVSHEQVYGTIWHKVAFFVRMNSAPGANDGVASMYFDGQRVFHNDQIAWVPSGSFVMPKWNFFSIGGNDNFQEYPNTDKRQEFYFIDDVRVGDGIPEVLI